MATRAARGDLLEDTGAERLEGELVAALRRKPTNEARLAGAIRALAPFSNRLKTAMASAVDTLVKRGSYTRPLYAACIRSLAELDQKRALPLIKRALSSDEAGGLATLSAACFVDDSSLAEPLARVATSRHPHLAFAAEVARIARREANGSHIASVAPKIKESHRIDLCVELFVPLIWGAPLAVEVAPALAVLRDAERHLGRWLVLAEIAVRSGDREPLEEARDKAREGPSSARAAWTLVAWALAGDEPPPSVRPTVELVARLSDRPSADRDTTFLYRLAEARAPSARPMLENLVRGSGLGNETAIRSALYLVRDHGREDLVKSLSEVVKSTKREPLRGLALAALIDAGVESAPVDQLDALAKSKHVCTMAWSELCKIAATSKLIDPPLVAESRFRRVQLGWVE
jgi:hypothetical protein